MAPTRVYRLLQLGERARSADEKPLLELDVEISTTDYAQQANISDRQARRRLNALTEQGVVTPLARGQWKNKLSGRSDVSVMSESACVSDRPEVRTDTTDITDTGNAVRAPAKQVHHADEASRLRSDDEVKTPKGFGRVLEIDGGRAAVRHPALNNDVIWFDLGVLERRNHASDN